MIVSKILIVSGTTIRVLFQNLVTYPFGVWYYSQLCHNRLFYVFRTLVGRSCSATCGLSLGGLQIMSQTGGHSMSTWQEGPPS